jgi:hypothetical protein
MSDGSVCAKKNPNWKVQQSKLIEFIKNTFHHNKVARTGLLLNVFDCQSFRCSGQIKKRY